MKHIFLMAVSVLLLAACSTPKYTYNFDYYDYNSGRKKAEAERLVAQAETQAVVIEESSPLRLTEEDVVASTSEKVPAPIAKPAGKKYSDMSKSEKKDLRKAVKTEVKKY